MIFGRDQAMPRWHCRAKKKASKPYSPLPMGGASRADFVAKAKAMGGAEISMPKKIVALEEIPLLGTGKTDYVGLKDLALKESDDWFLRVNAPSPSASV